MKSLTRVDLMTAGILVAVFLTGCSTFKHFDHQVGPGEPHAEIRILAPETSVREAYERLKQDAKWENRSSEVITEVKSIDGVRLAHCPAAYQAFRVRFGSHTIRTKTTRLETRHNRFVDGLPNSTLESFKQQGSRMPALESDPTAAGNEWANRWYVDSTSSEEERTFHATAGKLYILQGSELIEEPLDSIEE